MLRCCPKIAKQTFHETFAHDNTEEQLQEYFEKTYSLRVLSTELENPDSETYFIMHEEEIAGFLKVNWGSAQTERKLEDAFEIQRLYVLQKFQGFGLGKQLFEFALELATKNSFSWAWLGVGSIIQKLKRFIIDMVLKNLANIILWLVKK